MCGYLIIVSRIPVSRFSRLRMDPKVSIEQLWTLGGSPGLVHSSLLLAYKETKNGHQDKFGNLVIPSQCVSMIPSYHMQFRMWRKAECKTRAWIESTRCLLRSRFRSTTTGKARIVPEVNLKSLLQLLSTLETVSHPEAGTCRFSWPSWLASPRHLSASSSSALGLQAVITMPGFLIFTIWVLGAIELGPLCLHGNIHFPN